MINLIQTWIFITGVAVINAQTPCTEDQQVGSDPSGNSNSPPFTGYISFMIDHNNNNLYKINCCGVIKAVNLVADSTGTQTLQVWELVSGTTHSLVASEPLTIGTSGSEINVALTNKISVQSGYRYGWYGSPNIIRHKKAGNSSPENVHRFGTTFRSTVGQTLDWSGGGGGDYNNDNYSPAFELVLSPGSLPTLTSSVSPITLNTADAIGTAVTTITGSDADPLDTLTTITMTDATGQFSFDGSAVTTATSLAGNGRTVSLTFNVADQCNNPGSLTVSLTIINDPPTIHNLPSHTLLSEDTNTETLLHTISVTDSVDAVTCSLSGTSTNFEVKLIPPTTSYGIYTKSTATFNYATTKDYELTIDCDDVDPANTQTKKFYIYILKNSPPTVSNLQNSVTVSTTTAVNTIVYTVAATDPEGDTIGYAMSCPNDATCPFTISSTTGAITLTSDITTSTTAAYDAYVTVNDPTNTLNDKILTILISDINDQIKISNLPLTANYPVNENTAISTSIYTVKSKDQDVAQTKTYSITSTGSGLTYFTIDPSTGLISTSLSTMDYETLSAGGTTSFTLTVSVTDGVHTDSENLVIDIINVNEAPSFSQSSYSLTANEGLANAVIGTPTFGVVDPDTGDTQVYDMDCGNGYFFMDSSSGQVTFQSDYDLDQGLPSSVTCTVTVTDSGGQTDTAALILTVVDTNDHTPTFLPTEYTFYTSYYNGIATSIGRLTASDGDSATYGTLTYSLDQTNLPDQFFTVDSNGHVTLTKSLVSLGYGQSYDITGLVYDSGGLSDSSSIKIIIGDTTTAPTTTTTERYRKFAEDSRNMPWLVFSIVTAVICFCTLCWVICTCRGPNSLAATCRTWRYMRMHRTKMTHRKEVKKPPQPQQSGWTITIRKPPPFKGRQQWRTGGEGAPAGSVATNI